jgi:hypothetical protein
MAQAGILAWNRNHPFDLRPVAPFGASSTPTLKGKRPLRTRIFRAVARIGFSACALVAAIAVSPLPASAADGPFAEFPGSWSGAGTLKPENGAAERIRCNANYRQGSAPNEINLQLRCASDSYNFDLSGEFSVDGQRQVAGRWTERTRSVGGTAIGNTSGDRLQLHVESAGFAAELIMITKNKRQSVTIDSHGAGQVVKASISLSRS